MLAPHVPSAKRVPVSLALQPFQNSCFNDPPLFIILPVPSASEETRLLRPGLDRDDNKYLTRCQVKTDGRRLVNTHTVG